MTQKRITCFLLQATKCRVAFTLVFRAVVTLMVAAAPVMPQTGGGATLVEQHGRMGQVYGGSGRLFKLRHRAG
jgi:hypothetical protein